MPQCVLFPREIRVGSFRTTGLPASRATPAPRLMWWINMDALLRVLLRPKRIIGQGNLGSLLRENLDDSEVRRDS